jgi:hypothetical protein
LKNSANQGSLWFCPGTLITRWTSSWMFTGPAAQHAAAPQLSLHITPCRKYQSTKADGTPRKKRGPDWKRAAPYYSLFHPPGTKRWLRPGGVKEKAGAALACGAVWLLTATCVMVAHKVFHCYTDPGNRVHALGVPAARPTHAAWPAPQARPIPRCLTS